MEPDGSVGANEVVAVSMHNNAVETCIASIVGGMQFPKPKGGGSVIVHDPFIFDAK